MDIDHAVSRVGHEQLVEFRNVEQPLRLVLPHDRLNMFSLEVIYNLHGIVAQAGKNCQPAFRVKGEVIDTTRDTRQRSLFKRSLLRFEHQDCSILLVISGR
jgi:hypothetical protein